MPRYQSILFAVLLIASIVMGVFLWQMRERAHKRLLEGEDSASTEAPLVTPSEQATLYVASDADNALAAQALSLPLPAAPGPRARAIVAKLLDLYAAPGAPHPVPGGATSVLQVFLLPLPASAQGSATAAATRPSDALPSPASNLALIEGKTSSVAQTAPASSTAQAPPAPASPNAPQLAVVNLSGAFANAHPSGLEAESLTLLSICATLHANLPTVAEVRFLVDGAPRPTLAGHADLTRTYMASQAAPNEGIHP